MISEYRIITRVSITLTSIYYYCDIYKTRRFLTLLLFSNIKNRNRYI